MDLMGRTIWFIETHFRDELMLDDVAQAVGLSKFHLIRAFGLHTGQSVMRYVRLRRLSEAAKRLANENLGILDVALESRYASHEAFTRAFKDQFGITPEAVRKSRSLHSVKLVEPPKMIETYCTLSEPSLTSHDSMLIVGLKRRYSDSTSSGMPVQWQAFQPHIGHIDNQTGKVTFGVLCNSDDEGNIDYVTGVEVSECSNVAKELDGIRIPAQTYAVFRHDGHVSQIRRTWKTIFGKWLVESERKLVDAPQLERYGEGFDPKTGMGDIEIWVPVIAVRCSN